jgi:hypothetical protein
MKAIEVQFSTRYSEEFSRLLISSSTDWGSLIPLFIDLSTDRALCATFVEELISIASRDGRTSLKESSDVLISLLRITDISLTTEELESPNWFETPYLGWSSAGPNLLLFFSQYQRRSRDQG